ncbi:hypothetical protein ABNQ39_31485 [Azospirillum sp. A26]|uniref:hypothetical protein n=1 Tax=Azospirillum sp. A26 TaxID=3160607 RepID=UPI003670CC2F
MLSTTGLALRKIVEIAPSWTSSAVSIRPKTGWPTFNPSICWNGTEILTVIRTANYHLGPQWYSTEMLSAPLDLFLPGPEPRTVNYIGSLSEKLEWLRAPIPIVLPEGCGNPAWREGIEDCRLLLIDGALFAIATIYDSSSGDNLMGLIRLRDDGTISGVLTLTSPLNKPREKNWMPLVKGKILHLIYSCNPVIAVTIDFGSNTMHSWKVEDGPAELSNWAGSSQGCDVDGSMLCIVHHKVLVDDRLHYSHRFVMFDDDLHICALSAPFIFQHQGVEFCAGMTRVHDRLFVSYGVGDNSAMIGSLSVAEALDSLEWRGRA